MSVHRIPKWLDEVSFTISYFPRCADRKSKRAFRIVIYSAVNPPMTGQGDSIAQAAKDAIRLKL